MLPLFFLILSVKKAQSECVMHICPFIVGHYLREQSFEISIHVVPCFVCLKRKNTLK